MSYNEWLDIEVLEDYLDGKLDAKAMHQVEKLSLEDPFVAEALAGLSQLPRRTQSLSLLQKQLQERIAQKPVAQKRWRITAQRLSIAATAAVLFVTVSLLFWMRENKRQEVLAGKPKKLEVNIAPEMADIQGEAKENPQAKKAIDEALTKAKEQSLAQNKKPKIAPRSTIQSAMASEAVMDRREVESATVVRNKVEQIEVIAPAQAMRKEVKQAAAAMATIIPNNVGKLTGKVVEENGEPIIGAFVKLKGSNQVTSTDAKGEFALTIDSNLKQQKLAIGALGFKEKEVSAVPNELLNVALKQDDQRLSEVVVTGYGRAKKVTTPEPVRGWNRFERYLLNENKLLKDKATTGKEVRLSFTVDEKGRPVNIKIIDSLTTVENEEALRLINNGPNWKVQKNGSSAVTLRIKF